MAMAVSTAIYHLVLYSSNVTRKEYGPMYNLDNSKFWRWVCSRRAHDTPRGDFIRDTRFLVEIDIDPESRLGRACEDAKREYRRLRRQWDNAGCPDAPPTSRYYQ